MAVQTEIRPLPPSMAGYPVPVELLSALYRATEEEAEAIASRIPEPARARLALYCYGKSHLNQLGLRIAAGCAETTLVRAAGPAGAVLFEQSRAVSGSQATPDRRGHGKKVTLAVLPSMA